VTIPRRNHLFEKLAAVQVARPLLVLLAALVVTLAAGALALRLRLLTGFEHLLPEGRPSVVELGRVAGKTAGVSTLFVVLHAGEGPAGPAPKEALRKAGDALVIELGKLGSPWIGSVEDGVHEAKGFLGPRAGLYARVEDLEKLRDDIDARTDYEVARQMGTWLDAEPPPKELDPGDLRARFGGGSDLGDRFPDGYYQSKDGKVLVVAARSKVMGSDLSRGTEALARVKDAIAKVSLASYHPSITYGLAGDLYSGTAAISAINRDLTEVGITGVVLIGAVVFLYFLRVRSMVAMLITILVGVAWTFGFTELTIGHLNLATGFLFTIVAGNGINAGIIYLARYLEARKGGSGVGESVRIAHVETWLATLSACAAAAAAYGSLMITEFRGFRDFGVIGGAGMLLCWLATYLVMPSLLVVMERIAPFESSAPKGAFARFRSSFAGAFGRPFAALVPLLPRAITVVGLALAVAGAASVVQYIRRDPMEYDMKNLRNELGARAEESHNKALADEITGYVGSDAMAILVDRPEQVAPLRAALYARRDAVPREQKPFQDLHALEDFVPERQAEKVPLLLAIKERAERAHRRHLISDADWASIAPYLPPADLKPFTMAELPPEVARPFTEMDGTRGRIVYISPAEDTENARYLLRWADAYRRTDLPDGSTVLGSGRAVIYADMWGAILAAVPPAVSFSFLATLIVVLAAFRGRRHALYVLAALLVGIAWLGGLLVIMNVKLNFLNFIALPITFGIGADYAVNIVERYRREGTGGVILSLRATGGAVILCSLTTTLGYLALVSSMNLAVRSLGIAAVLGETACLGAAVLVLPAGLFWMDQRRQQRGLAVAAEGREPSPGN
jgi:predicted RND superfamily exporter protein